MRKLKKYLLTSLSLGLAGVSVGGIVVSCANSEEDVNPATSSLETKLGEPLTDNQKAYQKKVTDNIMNQINSAKESKDKPEEIDKNLKQYGDGIKNGPLKELVSKVNAAFASLAPSSPSSVTLKTAEEDASEEPKNPSSQTPAPSGDNSATASPSNPLTSNQELIDLVLKIYDNFKQKNLLPTPTHLGLKDETDAAYKPIAGVFSIFYLDPTNIVLYHFYSTLKVSIAMSAANGSSTGSSQSSMASLPPQAIDPLYLAIGTFYGQIESNSEKLKDSNSSDYQTWQYYKQIFVEVKKSLPTTNTPSGS